nr:hypothetical protein [uncultured bacterium]
MEQVPAHPLDRRGVEQAGVVVQARGQPLRALHEAEGHVELCSAGPRRFLLPGEADRRRLLRPPLHLRLEQEHHLEHRRAPGVPRHPQLLHHLFEGEVLVRVGAEEAGADARHQLGEGRVARQVDADRQRIDEEADQRLQLLLRSPGDGRAQHHVLGVGVAAEPGAARREKRHERRRPLGTGQGGEAPRAFRGHRDHVLPAAPTARPRVRPVHRELGGGRGALQLGAPEGDLLVQRLPRQLLPLPDRVVAVLDGELGKRRRLARREGPVEDGQLPKEHPDAPAVGNDVVEGDEQEVLLRGEAQQPGAE